VQASSKNDAPAKQQQKAKEQKVPKPISPVLRSWLDGVIIPIIVGELLGD
jgi:hypothetical protein